MTLPCQRLALLEAAVEQSFNAVVITDANMAEGGPFIVYANQAFCAMTGYAAEALIGRSPRILQGPDTDPDVIARLRLCLSESLFFEGSTVNYNADGSAYFVEWNISPVRDDTGTVRHFVSVQQDISQRVRADQNLHMMEQALNVALDPIFITDRCSTVVFANEAFQSLTGYSATEIVGQTPRMLRSGKHEAIFYTRFNEALRSGRAFRTTVTNKRKDGSLFHTDQSIAPLLNAVGEITHYVSISHDVTKRIGREQKLLKIAHSDPLTGLYNRRACEQALEQNINTAHDSGNPFSLIICDIDHFKSINDRYGHPVGDHVLKSVADILLHRIRVSDIAARWGGEEFLVLVPNGSLKQAVELAERIRNGVAETGMVTISLGVAELFAGENAESLIQRADKALYRAKRGGRNRIERAQKVTRLFESEAAADSSGM